MHHNDHLETQENVLPLNRHVKIHDIQINFMCRDRNSRENEEDMVSFTFNMSRRTKRLLDEIAKTNQTSTGSELRRISNRYVGFGSIAKRRREISLPREILKILFRNMDEQDIEELSDTYYNIARNDLELKYPKLSICKIENALRAWAKFSDYNLAIEEDPEAQNEYWIMCRHDLTKNWSDSIGNSIVKLLEEKKDCLVIKADTVKTDTLLKIHYRVAQE